jgi:hypothetical protein
MSEKDRSELLLPSLPELQTGQKDHDVLYHPDLEALPVNRQIAHTLFHINKVMGQIGDYLEKADHGDLEAAMRLQQQMEEKAIPDLLAYVLKLSNITGIDLLDLYKKRLAEDREKQKKTLGAK